MLYEMMPFVGKTKTIHPINHSALIYSIIFLNSSQKNTVKTNKLNKEFLFRADKAYFVYKVTP